MIKEYKNYIFVDLNAKGVTSDCSDGYLKSRDEANIQIKLPHKNYELLGIVDECLTAPYAEEFSKEIVDYSPNGGGYWNYSHEGVNGWVYQFKTAVESMKTLIEKLDLKPTDYILKDEN